jgi:hypothetical protein
MKMFTNFTRILAGTAALLLAVGVMSAATLQSADASGTDTGPCITAVWKDDPTIKAQRGNCPSVVEEPAPTPTPTPTATQEATITYTSNVKIGLSDPSFGEQDVDIVITDWTGKEHVRKTIRTDENGYGYVLLEASGAFPARYGANNIPTYDVQITLSDLAGYMYSGEVRASDFTKTSEDGTTTSYTLTGESLITADGVWVDRF